MPYKAEPIRLISIGAGGMGTEGLMASCFNDLGFAKNKIQWVMIDPVYAMGGAYCPQREAFESLVGQDNVRFFGTDQDYLNCPDQDFSPTPKVFVVLEIDTPDMVVKTKGETLSVVREVPLKQANCLYIGSFNQEVSAALNDNDQNVVLADVIKITFDSKNTLNVKAIQPKAVTNHMEKSVSPFLATLPTDEKCDLTTVYHAVCRGFKNGKLHYPGGSEVKPMSEYMICRSQIISHCRSHENTSVFLAPLGHNAKATHNMTLLNPPNTHSVEEDQSEAEMPSSPTPSFVVPKSVATVVNDDYTIHIA